jgi:hypothetical protein
VSHICREKKGASALTFFSYIEIYEKKVSGKGNHHLNPNYITGFVDGEGCFHITISKKTGCKTGYSVNLVFSVGLHSKDADLLRSIQGYFGGIGVLSVTDKKVLWRVLSVKELKVIIDHFDNYPLITKKGLDFLLFKEALQLFINKDHLTPHKSGGFTKDG